MDRYGLQPLRRRCRGYADVAAALPPPSGRTNWSYTYLLASLHVNAAAVLLERCRRSAPQKRRMHVLTRLLRHTPFTAGGKATCCSSRQTGAKTGRAGWMGLVQPNRSCTMKRQTYRTSSKAGRCQNAQIAVRAAYSMYSMVQVALVTSTALL